MGSLGRAAQCFPVLTGINTLVGYDLVPEPKIIDAALRACRRLNDFASAVRILEVVKVSGARGAAAAFLWGFSRFPLGAAEGLLPSQGTGWKRHAGRPLARR